MRVLVGNRPIMTTARSGHFALRLQWRPFLSLALALQALQIADLPGFCFYQRPLPAAPRSHGRPNPDFPPVRCWRSRAWWRLPHARTTGELAQGAF